MKKCKEITCQSNRDGFCTGNWAECPGLTSKKSFSSGKLFMILIAIAIVLACIFVYNNHVIKQANAEAAVVPQVENIPGPEVKQGKYTIFQYCQNGWTNHLYATAYYENDHKVYAELREYPGEFIPVDGQTLLIPEWVEDVDELMKYGFWEPMEFDW